MSFSLYLTEKLRKKYPEEAKLTDKIIQSLHHYFLNKLEYRCYLVDLYHDDIVYKDFPIINFDSLLVNALKHQLPLAKKIPIPILHDHLINGQPIFYHTDQLLRVERGEEKIYYIPCGGTFRRFDIDRWEVTDEELKQIDCSGFCACFSVLLRERQQGSIGNG